MALLAKEKYAPIKIEKLHEYLKVYQEQGKALDFEIIVDGFKAVRRTNDPSMFQMFEGFINADTKAIEILFFTGTSNYHDRYIFTLSDEYKEPDSKKKKKWEFDQLTEKNEQLQAEIMELEKEIEQLEKEKAEWEASKSPLQNLLGGFAASMVENFVRSNPNIVKGLPGGEALAGIIEEDNKRKAKGQQQTQESEPEIIFKPKKEESARSEEDKTAIQFVNQLKRQFSRDEFDKIVLILETLAEDKDKIDIVIERMGIKKHES